MICKVVESVTTPGESGDGEWKPVQNGEPAPTLNWVGWREGAEEPEKVTKKKQFLKAGRTPGEASSWKSWEENVSRRFG